MIRAKNLEGIKTYRIVISSEPNEEYEDNSEKEKKSEAEIDAEDYEDHKNQAEGSENDVIEEVLHQK